MSSPTRRRARFVVALTAALLSVPSAALAHAEISPTETSVATEVQFTITSIVERPEAFGMNVRMDTVVPRDFTFVSCDLPLNWICTVDTETYAPDTLLTWEPIGVATPADVNFAFTAVTPEEPGTWLFRTLQQHFDGYTEPWAYDTEPYPAPRVTVGGGETLVNGEGSEQDPACFGPDAQPEGYDAHDGSASDEGCVIPDTEPDDGPTASPTEREPAPTPATTPSPAPATATTELPTTGAPVALTAIGLTVLLGTATAGVRRRVG